MTDDIDLHLGRRLRRRRQLLGLTQQEMAERMTISFQQIQKYECGANRISAARLWQLANALEVPVGYFYDGFKSAANQVAGDRLPKDLGMPHHGETQDLIRAYYALGEKPRRRLLDLAKSLGADKDVT